MPYRSGNLLLTSAPSAEDKTGDTLSYLMSSCIAIDIHTHIIVSYLCGGFCCVIQITVLTLFVEVFLVCCYIGLLFITVCVLVSGGSMNNCRLEDLLLIPVMVEAE